MEVKHARTSDKTIRQIWIGKGSALANRFDRYYDNKYGRTHTGIIQAYRAWLWKKIRTQDQSVMRLMRLMREEITLLCYCNDASCHGPIVVKAWTWLKAQGLVDKPALVPSPFLDPTDDT